MLHHLLVLPPVGLRPQGVHRRPFAAVEHPVLDAGRVCRPPHLAAQRVQLPHQMPLAGAADGGVAGHVAHGVQVDGKDDGLQPQAGGGQSRLNAGVSGADDGNIKLSGRKGFHTFLSFFQGDDLCKFPKFPLHFLSDRGILPLETREERSVIVL